MSSPFKSLLKLLIPTVILAVLAVLIITLVPGISRLFVRIPNSVASATSSPVLTDQEQVIKQALEKTIRERQDVPAFQLFKVQINTIKYSPGDNEALAFLLLTDPQTGNIISPEPFLVVVRLTHQVNAMASSSWSVTLPSDTDYIPVLQSMPSTILPPELRDLYVPSAQAVAPQTVGPLGGYHLPWAAGISKRLTGSIGHFLVYNSCSEAYCRYAFDFADRTHFPIAAARGGTVFGFRWTCPDRPDDLTLPPGDCTNYISLEDKSTTPTTYQIYLHMSYNTIPDALRSIGAQVSQGDFLGNVDNTGYSYGSHVHFMVVADALSGSAGYTWGHSIDITFDEVTVNGGRPRTCFEASHFPTYGTQCVSDDVFVSANVGSHPPSGDLILPFDKTTVSDQSVLVGGWGSDDNGIAKLQMITNYDGTWREVGAGQTTTPFAFNLDMCSSGIPAGPYDLALRVYDVVGNQSLAPLGIRHLLNNASCSTPPPPLTCVPSASQIAIFSGINFSGSCKLLGIRSYPNGTFLSPVGDNQVSSILIGGPDIEAVLYDGEYYTKRNDTLVDSSRNLSSSRIGVHTVSSISVRSRSTSPDKANLIQPHGLSGVAPISSDSLILTWEGGGGSTKYTVELYTGSSISGSPILTRNYTGGVTWPIGSLAPGAYTWQVQGRAVDKTKTQYFSGFNSQTFTVGTGTLAVSGAAQVPYTDNMENGVNQWTATGLWHLGSDPLNGSNHAWVFNNGTDYGEGQLSSGDLTSVPILLPAGSGETLRFAYYYKTETSAAFWDQRWVQISVNDSAFKNLTQLSDDVMNEWLHSPTIDLSAYAGSTIRLRFHFDSIDGLYNSALSGWMVDDVSLNSTPPVSNCGDKTLHNTLATASTINYGDTIKGDICPSGNVDIYRIAALRGEQLVVEVDAQTLNPPSKLNPMVSLFLDPDDQTVLAENDDEIPGLLTDSYLHFTIPQDGIYYIRVKAHDYPGVGGPDYNYVMKVSRDPTFTGIDITPPVIKLTYPVPGGGLRSGPMLLSANASDEQGGSGINHVDFYWHSPDWTNGRWIYLSTDWRGVGGYKAVLDTSTIPQGQSIAVYAQAFDRAGNTRLDSAWMATVDNDPPIASFSPLPPAYPDTAIHLSWSANDTASGLDHFEIQSNRDNAGWQALGSQLTGDDRQAWFIGEFGHTYNFRLSAFDRAGNVSGTSETQTTVASSCQGDSFEPGDNNQSQATSLPKDSYQVHNFCPSGDVDWVKFDAEGGKSYSIKVSAITGTAARPSFTLFGPDGTTILAQASATGYNQWISARWTAPATGAYTLKLQSIDPAIAGPDVIYQVYVGTGLWTYYPLVFK